MAYITGLVTDFASRLHALPHTTGDLITGFIPEGNGYCGLVDINTSGKWEAEARRWYWELTAIPSGMLIQQF